MWNTSYMAGDELGPVFAMSHNPNIILAGNIAWKIARTFGMHVLKAYQDGSLKKTDPKIYNIIQNIVNKYNATKQTLSNMSHPSGYTQGPLPA